MTTTIEGIALAVQRYLMTTEDPIPDARIAVVTIVIREIADDINAVLPDPNEVGAIYRPTRIAASRRLRALMTEAGR